MPTKKATIDPPVEFDGIEGDPPEPEVEVTLPEPPPDLTGWVDEAIKETMVKGPRGLTTLSDGSIYLPARRRVQWMRGDAEPHPDWGIVTDLVDYNRGKCNGTKTVGRRTLPDIADGYATVRARIVKPLDNEHEQVIATGHATEYSEIFPDFVEKAETSAVARALALAGYGTESAVDLDEGLDKGMVADSPVRAGGGLGGGMGLSPIVINGSQLPGVGVGAQQTQITEPQFQHIRELARTKQLDPLAMKMAVDDAVDNEPGFTSLFPSNGTADEMRIFILETIREMTFDEAAKLIGVLELSDDPASP